MENISKRLNTTESKMFQMKVIKYKAMKGPKFFHNSRHKNWQFIMNITFDWYVSWHLILFLIKHGDKETFG